MADFEKEPTPGESDSNRIAPNLDRLSADDSAERPPLWRSFGKFLLWILLLAWLVVLGNYRAGNPFGLPESQVLSGEWFGRHASGLSGQAGSADVPQAGSESAAMDVPTPSPSIPAASPPVPAPESSNGEQVPEKPVSTWAGPMLDKIRQGEWAAASEIASSSGSSAGEDIAAFLRDVPDPDSLVVEAIMASRGSEIEILYNGKSRLMVPQSSLETVITASYNGRIVEVDAAKFDNAEKLRLIGKIAGENPLRHAAAVSVALRAGDREAVRKHIGAAGPMAKILGR